ncbi:uncharacterized protein MELLADRAFT_77962 [Melampsora larici-populina 98AG31]|uniref:RFX-type winged-helix domain-containing protein n=1 Tax=Melampsora larici-populina (strain 98AG31 / pathotype 3-4-7) TaxID=747676 RepID=F4RP09_MELLP|nr:uncharacterized protein MELLADRAFT_77962 [Melampsora larici-populina 98AG31]EGG05741.1 hypothetical protein MELLADRAFT_77962 [Melampsora larici-populina 98AG31]
MSAAPPPSVQVGGTTITAPDLLVGQYLRRVLRLPEPSRTRAWIATMFEADPEGEIEQVALWGMYRMQFEPHQGEDAGVPIPPLAAATDVITVMETVFRPDSYVGPDGMKRYVIRGLKLRPALERDAILDDMFRAPSDTASTHSGVGLPSTPHQAHHTSHTTPSSSSMITSTNHQSAHAHNSTPSHIANSRSPDLLDELDVVKIVHFPEPYRTRLWIASLFEPDPTSNAGPGGGGVEQVTLWQLYQKQFTHYVQEGVLGDKPIPQLAPATEVIKAVQDVFPDGRVVKNLLTITGVSQPGNTSNGSTAPNSQPDPVTAQLVTQVESLVKTVDDLQSVVKQQELIIKQELSWNATRQVNLRQSEPNSVLRPLSAALPTMTPSYPLDFPKTIEEANKLTHVQCVGLLERYGQAHLVHDSNEEKTREAFLEFIGCLSLTCSKSVSTPAVTSMV